MKQINEFKIKFKNNSLKSRQLIINNITIKNKRLFNFRSVMDKLNENSEFPFRTKMHHMPIWCNW